MAEEDPHWTATLPRPHATALDCHAAALVFRARRPCAPSAAAQAVAAAPNSDAVSGPTAAQASAAAAAASLFASGALRPGSTSPGPSPKENLITRAPRRCGACRTGA